MILRSWSDLLPFICDTAGTLKEEVSSISDIVFDVLQLTLSNFFGLLMLRVVTVDGCSSPHTFR
jgi:hypothetical protein